MGKARVQALNLGGVRPLLGTEHRCRAGGAAEGIVDIAHGDDLQRRHRRVHPRYIHGGDLSQGSAHGDEGFPRSIDKPDAAGTGRAAAAVVGGAAAQAHHRPLGAVVRRVDQQLPHAVGGGGFRVLLPYDLRKARRRGHLDHRRAVGQQGIKALQGPSLRTGDGPDHPLSAQGRQKGLGTALSAVGHRQRHHLCLGQHPADPRLHGRADLGRGHGPLEGIRYQHELFHGKSLRMCKVKPLCGQSTTERFFLTTGKSPPPGPGHPPGRGKQAPRSCPPCNGAPAPSTAPGSPGPIR